MYRKAKCMGQTTIAFENRKSRPYVGISACLASCSPMNGTEERRRVTEERSVEAKDV